METLNAFELIPTKKELTQLVDSFAEAVKCLMDIRGARTETIDEVASRHRDDDVDYFDSPKPLSLAAKYYRKTVLEDGTVIRLLFNPDNPLNDGTVPVQIGIELPEDKHIKISSLKDARLLCLGITNYDKRYDDYSAPSSEQRVRGYQFIAGQNLRNRVLDVDGFSNISEDANNAIRSEILHELHKLIIEAMYQPYQRPARSWFQKIFS